MTEPTALRRLAEGAFDDALERSASRPALAAFHRELLECRDRLARPMRVAVVGLIKAGKSTMINALLGEPVVATGTVEATFNVNWLHHGESSRLEVHFKDGRPPEERAFADLDDLTRRPEQARDELLSIAYVRVACPNPVLRGFDLIDTPGLASSHEVDSQNTLDFLRLHGEGLTEATQAEASRADAVVYLFSQGMAATDQGLIEQFRGPAMHRATPINAIGVLTRVDSYWSAGVDPMEGGRKIIDRLGGHPDIRPLFYSIRPACGLLALGAQTLTAVEHETLVKLATMPEDRFEHLIRHAERFVRPREDLAIDPERRRAVLARLGQYGVWLACRLIREGTSGAKPLAESLLARSGVAELRAMIASHFGNRAFLIKLCTGLRRVEKACFEARRHASADDRPVLDAIAGQFQRLEAQEHAFQEFGVVRAHYEGRLNLTTEESSQLLQVTGENGPSCAERLGCDPDTPIPELVKIAAGRAGSWSRRADDHRLGDPADAEAAEIVLQSYERIAFHLRNALEWLTI